MVHSLLEAQPERSPRSKGLRVASSYQEPRRITLKQLHRTCIASARGGQRFMPQDEEYACAQSPAPCSAVGNSPSTTKGFQMSIRNETVRLYQEIKRIEVGILDLVLSGARPFD